MPQQIRSLQALRGVACLAVIVFHMAEWEAQIQVEVPLLGWVRRIGFLGVDLFFVISGFIITWTQDKHIGQPSAVGPYVGKRLWRIYPLYWVCWLGALLVHALRYGNFGRQNGWRTAWRNQLLLWPTDSATHLLPVAWSLTFEIVFYVAFAVVIACSRRWTVRILAAWTVLLAASMTFLRVESTWNCPPISPLTMEFLIGCWTAIAVRRIRTESLAPLALAALGIALALATFQCDRIRHFSPWRSLLVGLPFGLLIFAMSQRERAHGLRLPGWICRIGDASYSLYLTHWTIGVLVITTVDRWRRSPLSYLWWDALLFGAIIGGGWLCFLGVERPLVRAMRPRRPKTTILPEMSAPLSRAA